MKQVLEDIRQKLKDGIYKNEEHVRLSLVARLLIELGWNPWNPAEVYTEFLPAPDEDSTRVDVALLLSKHFPSVFIEVKAPDKLQGEIRQFEYQLRDYNRNNTALFTIITDGQRWRFYFSQTGGEFSKKCFKTLDLLTDEFDDLESAFRTFLSKSEIANGSARRNAESYLQLSQEQKAMEDAMPQARKAVLEPPYPNLPEAIVNLVVNVCPAVTLEKAARFIQKSGARSSSSSEVEIKQSSPNRPPARRLSGDRGDKGLEQILEVFHEMETNGCDYTEACNKVARSRGIGVTTVNDKCTRYLDLHANDFRKLIKNKQQFYDRLAQEWPEHRAEIRAALGLS
jgi:hypothetical protein